MSAKELQRKEYSKKYKQEHKEEEKAYNQKYYAENKSALLKADICGCGGKYSKFTKHTHFKSKRHRRYEEKQAEEIIEEEIKADEPKDETDNKLAQLMQDINDLPKQHKIDVFIMMIKELF